MNLIFAENILELLYLEMKKRIFLLPGFGEDAICFNNITPLIKDYELIPIDYRSVLNNFIFPIITRKQLCRKLIEQYGIKKEDKLIGHSLGGYLSFQIREILGTEICMIASFSDPKKLIHTLPKYPRITQIIAYSGLIKNKYLKQYLLNKIKNETYKEIQQNVMENFSTFSNAELGLLLETTYEKGIISDLPNPLRIHDKADRIVAMPDEDFVQVEGGHFCLNIYPEKTFESMKDFLK